MPSLLIEDNQTQVMQDKALASLRAWWQGSQEQLFHPQDQGNALIYGTGYNTWGVQTQQKAIAAAMYLWHQGDELAASQAVDLLRFNLNTHLSSAYACTDGEQWGHTWISVLGIERMMFAIDLIHDRLPKDVQEHLRQVLISEADWLLQEYPVVAGLVDDNKPESNIWNGAILHRVALMYPDAPHAAAYQTKGDKFLYNGISIESDLQNEQFKDIIVGANFFESMALNHHHYLNVGYMVICLSNIAMLHFTYKLAGKEAPESLYHHAYDLWSLIKTCTFEDGRLWRIGGDTRVRYCYCQDYALPMWLFIEDYYGEDCSHWIDGWLDQVITEQDYNGDGTYLAKRLETMTDTGPLYYTRLESDRACTVAMTAAWLPMIERSELQPAAMSINEWHDAYHQSYMCRNDQRMVSWTWDAGEGPTGMCIPSADSSMAEWGANLFPLIRGTGDRNAYERLGEYGYQFPGGFATLGQVDVLDQGIIGEGRPQRPVLANVQVASIALPDQKSNLIVQYVRSGNPNYLSEVQGLHVLVPNDLWNNFERHYQESNKGIIVDEALSIQPIYQHGAISDEQTLQVKHNEKRTIGMRHNGGFQVQRVGGFLKVDEIALPQLSFEKVQRFQSGTILIDNACLLSCTDTFVYENKQLAHEEQACKIIELKNQEQHYIVVCNFSDNELNWEAPSNVGCIHGKFDGRLKAHQVAVFSASV